MKKTLLLILMLGSIGTIATAQKSFQFHFGAALPTGRFASSAGDFYEGSGNATTGFTVGVKALFPLRQEGLSFTAGMDILYNGWTADYKARVDEDMTDVQKYSKYLNVPIMAGIEYNKSISSEMKLFGTFGLGLNILKVTPFSDYDKRDDYTYVVKFATSTKGSYRLGGGLVINDKYILGLQYYGLGNHIVKYSEDYTEIDGFDEKFERPLTVGALNLTFGIKF